MDANAALDPDALIAAARASTSLHELGAGPWREGLVRLIEAARGEARLDNRGVSILRAEMLAQLRNRLEIHEWVGRHPEVRALPLDEPIVLATLPRTGQTAAGWLLDRDRSNRALLTWMAKRPVPPPLPGDNADDPRVVQARAAVDALPEKLRAMHLTGVDEPDECHWLISNAFRGAHQIYSMQVPSFYSWSVDDAGMTDAYAYYRLQLQILQAKTPGRRWVLKNSPHLLHLNALHTALPDAHYVQFHRDPVAVLASNCRLSMFLRGMRSARVEAHEVGASMLRLLTDYVERTLAFRDAAVTRRWIDVHFDRFVANPVAAVERIYAAVGIDLSNETRAAMERWVAANPREERRPKIDLSPFGLDVVEVRKRFAPYAARFQVPAEGAEG